MNQLREYYANLCAVEKAVAEKTRRPIIAAKILRQMCIDFGWRHGESFLKKEMNKTLSNIRLKNVGLPNIWGAQFAFCEEEAAYRFLLRLGKEGKISLPAAGSFDDLRAQWEVSTQTNKRSVQ